MENLNLHKQRLYALILAAVALIAIILPWLTVSLGGFGNRSANGLRGWGYLSLLGIAGVVIASFMGDKTKPYDDMYKKVAMGSFAAIAVGAIVFFVRIQSYGSGGYQGIKTSPGLGLWLCLAAGLAGLAWVAGLIKVPDGPKPPSPPPPPSV